MNENLQYEFFKLFFAVILAITIFLVYVIYAEVRKWAWIEAVNKLFFQWFFVRFSDVRTDGKTIGYGFIWFVVPLTGWRNKYKFILTNRRKAFWYKKGFRPQ